MKRLIDCTCESCGAEKIDVWVDGHDYPVCECGKPMVRLWRASNVTGVIPDDIPGGVEIKHGLCNPDGTPRKYYSRTEIRKECAKRGIQWGFDRNEHVTAPGTDKAPHTRKW